MKKGISLVCLVALLLTTLVLLTACGEEKKEPVVWSSLELGSMLPDPALAGGDAGVDLSTALSVSYEDITKEQYKEYKERCISVGYTIEAEDTGTSYVAFNSEGYELRLSYSFEDLYIHLNAPEEMGEFEWPSSGLGSLLPATTSTLGDISWNNSETFIVHVGNTTIDEYNNYVKACEEKGFILDYSKDDEYYSAKNSDGYKLTLRYLGFNNIEVSLKAPETASTNNDTPVTHPETTAPIESTLSNSASTNGLNAEFKEAMDSYEQFMDEYVAFMKKYSENPADLSLLADYATYMSKYAEFVKDFEKWESQDMNTAETAYYVDVQARVTKKLLEITQ